MDIIRIVELPPCVMASSGVSTESEPFAAGGRLMRFNEWWTAVDATRRDRFFPRDFMWFDRVRQGLVWWYAVPEATADTEGFDAVDFEGGLYAAAISRDGDDGDGERVYDDVKAWVAASDRFDLDERDGHYDLFHIITPNAAASAMGYRQLEIFVPIRLRAERP